MGWDDRPYYRDHSGASANPFVWLVSGSAPMFTAFRIRVRAHAALIVFILATILLDWEKNYQVQFRVLCMAVWTVMLTFHELGHCFALRLLGGEAREILMWPLGGLVFHQSPNRGVANFLTAAAGPAVNLALCIIAAAGIYAMAPMPGAMHGATAHHVIVSLNPFHSPMPDFAWGWKDPAFYCWWIFFVNYRLFLLNLLPIFPLDGGQILQVIVGSAVGQFKSLMFVTAAGMAGSVAGGLASLAFVGVWGHAWFLAALMAFCFFECYRQRMALRDMGHEDWRESIDYSASLFPPPDERKRRRLSRRAIKKARKIALHEKAQRDRVDSILAKVSARGMQSLTWSERRTLRKATEAHRRRELELSQFQ
jgi:stage IV sporulation protein FB